MTEPADEYRSTAPRDRVVMLGLVSFFIVMSGGFYWQALQKLERITQSAERTEARINQAMDGAAPLGKAVVNKGVDTLQEMPTEELAKGATDGIKEIGSAAKDKALKWLKEQGSK